MNVSMHLLMRSEQDIRRLPLLFFTLLPRNRVSQWIRSMLLQLYYLARISAIGRVHAEVMDVLVTRVLEI